MFNYYMCTDLLYFITSRRRHTRLQGDWSSDVCSSDLQKSTNILRLPGESASFASRHASSSCARRVWPMFASGKIGRASCRERVEISMVEVRTIHINQRRLDNKSISDHHADHSISYSQ